MNAFESIPAFCSAVGALAPEITPEVVGALSARVILRYRSAWERKAAYHEFSIPKKSGGERRILAPAGPLKDILTCTAHLLGEVCAPSDAVMGFVPGRSVVTNASRHVGRSWVFNTDLEDFFTSIGAPKVEHSLVRSGVDPMVARLVSTLCTYPLEEEGRIRNVLPQGSPASPVLSNIACSAMDVRLEGLARRFGLVYTRYADDLTFSGDRRPGGEFLRELEAIVGDNGFSLSARKTRTLGRWQRQEVTGLTVVGKVNVPRAFMKNLRAAVHQMERSGPDWEEMERVEGRLAWLGMVRGKDDPAYRKLRHRLKRIKFLYKDMP